MKQEKFEWYIDDFLCYCKSKELRPKSLNSYEQTLRLFEAYVRIEKDITVPHDVTEQDIRDYLINVKERGKYTFYTNEKAKNSNFPERRRDYRQTVSNTTINNYIRNVKVFFNWLYSERIIRKNPIVKIKQLPNKRKAKDFINDIDFSKLIRRFDLTYFSEFRDYVAINLMIDTGMRLGECLALKMEEIDVQQRVAYLSEEVTKGRKDRSVFFSIKMASLLRRWLQFKDRYCNSDIIFPIKNGLKSVDIGSFETNFKNYIKRAGLTETLSPHCLRNNFAKRCIMNGMDIYTLSRILGHSSVVVTEQAYLDLTDDDIKTNYQKYSPLEGMRKNV